MLIRLAAGLTLGMLLFPAAGFAQPPKVKDIAVAPHWIYDDVPAAFTRAKETNKPILALFR